MSGTSASKQEPAISPTRGNKPSWKVSMNRDGGNAAVMDALYEMADLYVQPGSQNCEYPDLGISPAEGIGKIIIDDGLSGHDMLDLIWTLHPDVLSALIDNTFAWRYFHEPQFLSKLYGVDDCCGTYIVTYIVENDQGDLISREDWRKFEKHARGSCG
ncbi:hypothetical protein GLAREA_05817 [Glarea lozoyensis ATCC 20868]|uniref:Uncharacterized protein n=1 Tax=Glarea lozoyensis (strain ATCC 20868 / MF5171) TaxID=1116229 RepID=S3D4W4_GLAL2|nr:uncharacterized protein GLAREA_05817 [Glarea lozoyensis ATCC 20868]EPE32805.1 hypothetical protein GLAREA_05817 [Glarea lozoyensis ATCC 20868]